jgi:hypothetical protein
MPAQVETIALGAKFGQRIAKAQGECKGQEASAFGARLPGGIRNGVAIVRECRLVQIPPGQNYAGDYRFQLMGVVVEPKVHAGVPIEGLQTRQFVTLADTKTAGGKAISFEQNYAEMNNHLKLLVGRDPVDAISGSGPEVVQKLQALMQMVEGAGIYTRFSTSTGKERIDPVTKKPLPSTVFENWLGRVDYKSNGQPQQFTDNTAPAAPVQESPAQPSFDPAADELADLAALADRPDNSPESAQATKTLKARALAAGVAEADVDIADNWAAVAELIKAAEAVGPAEEGPVDNKGPVEEDEGPWQASAVGKVVTYKLLNAKTKKKVATQCEVTAVQTAMKTVHLKNLTTGNVLVGGDKKPFPVKWDQIELVS